MGEALGCEARFWDADPRPLRRTSGPWPPRWTECGGCGRAVPANTNLCFYNGEAADSFAVLMAEYAKENPMWITSTGCLTEKVPSPTARTPTWRCWTGKTGWTWYSAGDGC